MGKQVKGGVSGCRRPFTFLDYVQGLRPNSMPLPFFVASAFPFSAGINSNTLSSCALIPTFPLCLVTLKKRRSGTRKHRAVVRVVFMVFAKSHSLQG